MALLLFPIVVGDCIVVFGHMEEVYFSFLSGALDGILLQLVPLFSDITVTHAARIAFIV